MRNPWRPSTKLSILLPPPKSCEIFFCSSFSQLYMPLAPRPSKSADDCAPVPLPLCYLMSQAESSDYRLQSSSEKSPVIILMKRYADFIGEARLNLFPVTFVSSSCSRLPEYGGNYCSSAYKSYSASAPYLYCSSLAIRMASANGLFYSSSSFIYLSAA